MNFKLNPYDWYKTLFRNPKYRPFVVALTLFYIIIPFDFDFIPIIGFIDDGILLTVFISELVYWVTSNRGSHKDTTSSHKQAS
jgi:uncharacterized membrane protein YkvA (DUF1232 family)